MPASSLDAQRSLACWAFCFPDPRLRPILHPRGFTPTQYGFIIPDAFAHRNLDLRPRKGFQSVSRTTLGVTVDRLQLGAEYNF